MFAILDMRAMDCLANWRQSVHMMRSVEFIRFVIKDCVSVSRDMNGIALICKNSNNF